MNCKKHQGEPLDKNSVCKTCKREYMQAYCKTNKERIAIRQKEWNKKYYDKNVDTYRANARERYRSNKEFFKAKTKSPSVKFSVYKHAAKLRGISFELTLEDHFTPGAPNTFWQKPCYYCGDPIETIGLDRLDSLKGYTIDNVVPCCFGDNEGKNNRCKEEYILRCNKVAKKHPRNV